MLRDETTAERLDLGSEVELTHLRTEATFEGSLSLTANEGEVTTILGDGAGKRSEPEKEALSKIVEELNERFGLDLSDTDQLLFDQFEEGWVADEELAAQARNNTMDNFKLVFRPKFLTTVVTRMDANEAIFKQILDDEEFRGVLSDFYLRKVYQRLRSGM
jgi:type I restriction enzyme R subunit